MSTLKFHPCLSPLSLLRQLFHQNPQFQSLPSLKSGPSLLPYSIALMSTFLLLYFIQFTTFCIKNNYSPQHTYFHFPCSLVLLQIEPLLAIHSSILICLCHRSFKTVLSETKTLKKLNSVIYFLL